MRKRRKEKSEATQRKKIITAIDGYKYEYSLANVATVNDYDHSDNVKRFIHLMAFAWI